MPNTTFVEAIAARVQAATVEADSDDEESSFSAVPWQIDTINELAALEAVTPDEVAAKAKVCLVVLAAGGGLAEAMDCTRALVKSVLEEAARLSVTKS